MQDLLSSVINFLRQFTLKYFLFWQEVQHAVQHHTTAAMPCLIIAEEQKKKSEK